MEKWRRTEEERDGGNASTYGKRMKGEEEEKRNVTLSSV